MRPIARVGLTVAAAAGASFGVVATCTACATPVVGTPVDLSGASTCYSPDAVTIALGPAGPGGERRGRLPLRGREVECIVRAQDRSSAPTLDVVAAGGGAVVTHLTGTWTDADGAPRAWIEGDVELPAGGAGAVARPYRLEVSYSGGPGGEDARLSAAAKTFEFGQAALGDRTFRYALRDRNVDGSFADLAGLEVIFDRDGDEVFDDDAEGVDATRSFDIGTGTFVLRSVSDDGTRVEFGRGFWPRSPRPFLGTGDVAPELAGVGLDGRAVSLAERRGRKTLLLFWATWCGPCCREMEEIVPQWDAFRAACGADVVGVSLDTDVQAARDYGREHSIPFPTVFDGGGWESANARAYGIRSIPCAVLVGVDGRIETRRVFVDAYLAAK